MMQGRHYRNPGRMVATIRSIRKGSHSVWISGDAEGSAVSKNAR